MADCGAPADAGTGSCPTGQAASHLDASRFDPARKISSDEMVELFGEKMPSEAVNLLFASDESRTIGELRAELRRIAAEKRKPFDPISDDPAKWGLGGWGPTSDDPRVAAAFSWADATGVGRGSGAFGYFVRAYVAGTAHRDSDGSGEAGQTAKQAEPKATARAEGIAHTSPEQS